MKDLRRSHVYAGIFELDIVLGDDKSSRMGKYGEEEWSAFPPTIFLLYSPTIFLNAWSMISFQYMFILNTNKNALFSAFQYIIPIPVSPRISLVNHNYG